MLDFYVAYFQWLEKVGVGHEQNSQDVIGRGFSLFGTVDNFLLVFWVPGDFQSYMPLEPRRLNTFRHR